MIEKRFKVIAYPLFNWSIADEKCPYSVMDVHGATNLLNDLYDENKKLKDFLKEIIVRREIEIGKGKTSCYVGVYIDIETYDLICKVV